MGRVYQVPFVGIRPIMPGRTAAKKRTAQKDWTTEQKTKASKQQTEEEEDKDSDNDSGVEDKEVEEVEETIAEAVPEEEDAPLQDWTKKELAEECKTLGLSDKGNKASLIERIEEARAKSKTETVVEPETIEDKPVEDVTAEETEEGASTEISVEAEEAVVSEPVIGESTPVEAEASETEAAKPEEEEEDAPIEEWTKKELVEECKNLGISDKGNKAALIEIIKETWANKKEIAESAAPLEVEEAPVVEAEDAPVAEKPAETETEPEASEPEATETAETPVTKTEPEAAV